LLVDGFYGVVCWFLWTVCSMGEKLPNSHPIGGGGGEGVWWVRKGRKYIWWDPRFFVLVLLCSITPLSSTLKAACNWYKGRRKT
jgi:hypothetical protein